MSHSSSEISIGVFLEGRSVVGFAGVFGVMVDPFAVGFFDVVVSTWADASITLRGCANS